ncbi:MAG: aldo/keto reductase, partial [Bacteroidales bacterium]|nr:aldo/keto reductase [Bacteroidales bacterium]
MSRREFLKRMGLGTAAVAGGALAASCRKQAGLRAEGTETGPIPTDKMTYRENPKTHDKVSILGYGCMRWPTLTGDKGEEIDQEAVNRLVDTAIAHGVNYFDTSPAYCKGLSERATGIALSRHPRD